LDLSAKTLLDTIDSSKLEEDDAALLNDLMQVKRAT
jgi:hypothetical protein